MTKLEKLYELASGVKEFDLKSKEAILQEINELEEELIKKEILPVVKDRIAPALSPVKRELVLVVEYTPNEPLTVKLSRKANLRKIGDLKELTSPDPQVEHTTHIVTHKVTHGSPSGLRIVRKNGTVIQEKFAADTLVKAIKEAGASKVRGLNLICCKVPLVSTTKDKKYGQAQVEVEPGLYVIRHSNNKMKKDFLETISQKLGLGWTVELIK